MTLCLAACGKTESGSQGVPVIKAGVALRLLVPTVPVPTADSQEMRKETAGMRQV